MQRLIEVLTRAVAAEQDRFTLWLPVLFGTGIAIYFALPFEPPFLPLALAAVAAVLLVGYWRLGLASLVIGGGLASVALGLAAAKLASDRAAGPVLQSELRGQRLTGWIDLVEPRADGAERITVRIASLDGLASDVWPRRVRVRIAAGGTPLAPGDAVSLSANLLPPGGPNLPGAYDFARTAWFLGVGAVGYARARPEPAVIAQPMPWALRLWGPVERLRQDIGRRIAAGLPGETGAIATALITGERGGISEATNAAYRDSGIIHILSISGLHMTVFAGAVYFSVRFLLSLFPVLSLGYPIKKWAAACGIAGTYAYLLISGGTPPAVRSAVMIAIMFLAVLLDRPALALRNVALAALIILAVSPPSLIDVGFQMSFACVVALISGLEAWRHWRLSRGEPDREPGRGMVRATALFLATITTTTLIASFAAAPFGAYYFHKSTQYGILANLVAVPICNLLVMPAALATLLAMPWRLEAWPLAAMGLGIDAMTRIALKVAQLPGAVAQIPELPGLAFGLMVAGGLWLALWGGRWRLAGLAPICLGLAIAPFRTPPDLLVSGSGALVAVRGPDGRYAALDAGRSSFELGRWLEADADPRPAQQVGPGRVFDCDRLGCIARAGGLTIAIARHPAAMPDDCRRATLIIRLAPGYATCPRSGTGEPAPRVIARDALARAGTHAIRLAPGGLSIVTVADRRGERPWSRQRASVAAIGWQ